MASENASFHNKVAQELAELRRKALKPNKAVRKAPQTPGARKALDHNKPPQTSGAYRSPPSRLPPEKQLWSLQRTQAQARTMSSSMR